MEVYAVTFLPWLLSTWGKSPQYSLNMLLGGPQNWFGHGDEDKKIPAHAGS